MDLKQYQITLFYTEPTYQMRKNQPPREYWIVYEITALTTESAVKQAIDQFEHTAMHSSVSWRRVILHEKTEVQLVGPASADNL